MFLLRLFGWSRDQRDIFRYHDGTRNLRADPLAIMTRLEDTCPDYADLLKLVAPDETTMPIPGVVGDELAKGRKEAVKTLIRVTRLVFGVKPLDQTAGLTDVETLQLLTRFLAFMGELAEAARPLPDSPPVESPSPAASPTDSSVVSTTIGT